MFDLDIVQWSVFIDNAWSPPPLLSSRGSGLFQSSRELICIVECLVNLIQQLRFNKVREYEKNSSVSQNSLQL